MTRDECWQIYRAAWSKFIESEFMDCEEAGMPFEEIARMGMNATFSIPLYKNEDGSKCEPPKPFLPVPVSLRIKMEERASRAHGCWPIPERSRKRINDHMEKLHMRRELLEKATAPGL